MDIDWQRTPQVTGIDENKNILTLQMHQFMEWEDLRIKSNLSVMQNMECPECWTKLFPPSVEKIWHPNLDMHIQDLWDWKSLYDPFWFESVGINRCSWMRNCNMASNVTHLYAEKSWRANVFCKFDFLLFPLDSQHCKFRQIFQSTSEFVKFFLYPTSKNKFLVNVTKRVRNWEYRGIGFDITIQPIGNLIGLSSEWQNLTAEFGFDIKLRRVVEPYLFQYYFPSAAIVVVSHISFIIPLSSIPGRVGLVVTQFLTLTNIFIHQMVRLKFLGLN